MNRRSGIYWMRNGSMRFITYGWNNKYEKSELIGISKIFLGKNAGQYHEMRVTRVDKTDREKTVWKYVKNETKAHTRFYSTCCFFLFVSGEDTYLHGMVFVVFFNVFET